MPMSSACITPWKLNMLDVPHFSATLKSMGTGLRVGVTGIRGDAMICWNRAIFCAQLASVLVKRQAWVPYSAADSICEYSVLTCV